MGLIALASTAPLLAAKKTEDPLDRVFAPLAEVKTVQGKFVQKKDLAAFEEVQVQKGYFKSGPSTVLFVVTEPVESVFAVKDGKALVRFPELSYEEITDLDASPTMGAAVRSLLAVLGATSADAVRESYTAEVEEAKQGWEVTLKPRDETLAKALSHIIMRIRDDGRVTHVGIHERSGDATLIDFSDVIFNESIDDPLLDF